MNPYSSFIVIIFLLTCTSLSAQSSPSEINDEIISQIWKPFKQSYEARDANTFKSIHTDDMLRITDSDIKTGSEYKASINNWTVPTKGSTITIDFALESSNVNQDVAYQVGYYRVIYSSKENPSDTYFGQFHVVLKKLDGIWKIVQDFDTAKVNGQQVDANFFKNASLLILR